MRDTSEPIADPSPPSPRRRGRGSRWKLHRVYFLLAAFDLITVSLGLLLIDRIMAIHSGSVAVNQVWARRLDAFSDLSQLATAVNAPGNNVFDTRDVEAESGRLVSARQRFDEQATAIRRDLLDVREGAVPDLLATLDDVAVTMDEMVGQAQGIFTHFRRDEPEAAGQRMAAMDRDFARVNAMLAESARLVRAIQTSHFERQTEAARTLRKFEFAIAGLIVLMVVAVTLYGHALALRMREAAQEADAHLDAVAEREATIRAVLASTVDPVVTIDGRRVIQSASDSVARVFGWTPAELIGCSVDTLVAGQGDGDEAWERCWRAERTDPSDGVRRFAAYHRDGHRVRIELSVAAVEIAGRREPLFTGVIRDVTERERVEAELGRYREHLEALVRERTAALEASHEQLRMAERLASIGTLAAGLGHDMNNVLFPIRCRLDALMAATLDPAARADVYAMRGSVQYLQQLSDGLRLLALDPDDPDATTGFTDLGSWWDEVRPLFLTALPRNATLEGDIEEDLPPLAVAPHRVTQAMFNLVVNAGEAISDAGTVRLWARARDDGGFVEIGVVDSGSGMPKEVRRRALDPFYTTKKRGLSTGLGLALVHGVAKAAGGGVEIDSVPGRGTTVALTLPAAPVRPDGPRSTAGGDRQATISLPDRRVATFVGSLLQSVGFDVRHAEAGADPGAATLWITDATEPALPAARRFLANGARRVIVVGDAGREWRELGAIVVDDGGGLEAIRNAIRAAATTSEEGAA